jgi:hypothetical protein
VKIEYIYSTLTNYEQATNSLLVFFVPVADFVRAEESIPKHQLG